MSKQNIDSGTKDLLVSLQSRVLTITLNRPEARNAFSRDLLRAFNSQLLNAEQDPAVRCIVVTGTGKAFCAGGDIKAMSARNAKASEITVDEAIHRQRVDQRNTAGRLYKIPKPTLAVLPGAAAGAGLSLALSCDLRIMASTAIMTTAFARVGFSGDYGGTLFMSQLIGAAKARELYYLSDRINAEQALQLGLTNWVVEPGNLNTKTQEIASRLAGGPSVAYRYMKENLSRALAHSDVDNCMDLEVTHHIHCASTQDHRNAVKAFIEKKAPTFLGS
tara:strand:+ start:2709 stop:3536 length:828 start_codon:yes stop_codon:yes gene_type:complete